MIEETNKSFLETPTFGGTVQGLIDLIVGNPLRSLLILGVAYFIYKG